MTSGSHGAISGRRKVPEGLSTQQAILGRIGEFDRLAILAKATILGAGAGAVICGEAGIGKTRLAEELVRYAKESGMLSLWGRCIEDSSAPPFWPWEQALKKAAEDDTRLDFGSMARSSEEGGDDPNAAFSFPFGGAIDDHGGAEKIRLFDRITRALHDLSVTQPLLITIDDLQWADSSTLELLEYAARELVDSPVMFLCTLRPHPTHAALSTALASFSRLPRFDRVDLYGLEIGSAAQLVESISGRRLSDQERRGLYELTNGLPLFIKQLGIALRDSSATLDAPGSYARTVRDIVDQRLALYSKRCIDLLRIASLIGRRFRLSIIAGVAKLSGEHALQALSTAKDGALVIPTEHPGEYEFAHDLVRETIRENLAETDLATLHAQIGCHLEEFYGQDSGIHALELFHHFYRAQVISGVEKAVLYAIPAGESALSHYAYEEANKIFEAGLSCLDTMRNKSETRAALLWGLIRSRRPIRPSHQLVDDVGNLFEYYEETGDYKKARQILIHLMMPERIMSPLCDRALKHQDKSAAEHAWLLLTKSMVDGYYNVNSTPTPANIDRAIVMARAASEPGMLLNCLLMASRSPFAFGHSLDTASAYLKEAREIARNENNLAAEVSIGARLAILALYAGRSREFESHSNEVFSLAAESDDQLAREECWKLEVVMLNRACRFEELKALLRSRIARNLPNDRALGTYHGRLVDTLLSLDRNDEAGEVLSDLISLARKVTDAPAEIILTTAAAIIAHSRQTGEKKHLEFGKTIVSRFAGRADIDRRRVARSKVIQGLIEARLGYIDGARKCYRKVNDLLAELSGEDPIRTQIRSHVGKLALAIGNLKDAQRSFRLEISTAESRERIEAQYNLARTLLARSGQDDSTEAESVLHDVRKNAEALGLKALSRMAVDTLKSIPRLQGKADVDAKITVENHNRPVLTHREHEVLRLVANGYTNKEIAGLLEIKTRTVDSHVAQILQKTGTANRAEAAVYAAATGLLEEA